MKDKQSPGKSGHAPCKGKCVLSKNAIVICNVSDQQMRSLLEQLCGNKGGIPPLQASYKQ